MNYNEVLYPYHPSERGDFMYRYLIDDREYVVYSPSEGCISCMELDNFKDISPLQLSILIQRRNIDEGIEEFEFKHTCSKDNLIMYLFDISERNGIKIKRTNNQNEGYLLYELHSSHKVRNIFQFNSKGEYQLLLDNEICYAAMFEELPGDINVCWNPITFASLENLPDSRKNTSFLLSSSNPILCTHIIKTANQRAAKINICVDKNHMAALLFLSCYSSFKESGKKIIPFSDSKNITVHMMGWYPTSLVNFISRINKAYNKLIEEHYNFEFGDEIMIYQLKTVKDTSFIIFPNNEIAMEVFLMTVVTEINTAADLPIVELSLESKLVKK